MAYSQSSRLSIFLTSGLVLATLCVVLSTRGPSELGSAAIVSSNIATYSSLAPGRTSFVRNRRRCKKSRLGGFSLGVHVNSLAKETDHELQVDTPMRAAELLNNGEVGVIPTDTSYAFVCKLGNKEGVERMYKIKEPPSEANDDEVAWQMQWKKGMSLLCKDIQQVQKYTDQLPDSTFKILKKSLPGPYTFILPTTNKLPKFVIEHRNQKRTWKRKEVGIRIPDNDILREIMDNIDEPLQIDIMPVNTKTTTINYSIAMVCTSVPFWSDPKVACSLEDVENTWVGKVDFVMAQEDSLGTQNTTTIFGRSVSTIIDFTKGEPKAMRTY
eukprot:jgi/Bigna1/77396/fgenesh1_pg.47_\